MTIPPLNFQYDQGEMPLWSTVLSLYATFVQHTVCATLFFTSTIPGLDCKHTTKDKKPFFEDDSYLDSKHATKDNLVSQLSYW